jgi:hypothetical protein
MKRWAVLATLLVVVFAGCSPASPSGAKVKLAPVAQLPPPVQKAPTRVREAYQFAVVNPDLLKQIPCYCGCGAIGHTSNYACYVNAARPDNSVTFDEHALGCSLCVDITQDAMRLSGEGKSAQAIRAEIVATYSKFGPPNQ